MDRAGRMLGEVLLQHLLLGTRQMPFTLAVIAQIEECEACCLEGKPPLRQHCWSDIQYSADCVGVFSRVQKQEGAGAFSYQRRHLAPAAECFKGSAFIISQWRYKI